MASSLAAQRAARAARRLAPIAIEAYRRWERLTPEEKERYRERMRLYGERARYAIQQTQERRRRPPS